MFLFYNPSAAIAFKTLVDKECSNISKSEAACTVIVWLPFENMYAQREKFTFPGLPAVLSKIRVEKYSFNVLHGYKNPFSLNGLNKVFLPETLYEFPHF